MADNNAFLRRLNAALPKEQRHPYEVPAPAQPARLHPSGGAPTIGDLLKLGRNAYSRTVQQHISGAHEVMWSLFLDPQLVTRTYQVLRRIHANLQRVAEEEKIAGSSSAAVRGRRRDFYAMATERLHQVEALLPDEYFLPGMEAQEALRVLTAAVHKHRELSVNAEVVPEEWDTRLWRAADQAGRFLRTHGGAEGEQDDE